MRFLLTLALVMSLSLIGTPRAAAATCVSTTGPGIPPPGQVPSGIPGFHAAWYGQSGYMQLCPGDSAIATVAYYNAGSQGWVGGRMGQAAYLGSWNGEPGQDQPSMLGGDAQFGSPNTGWVRFNRPAAQPASWVGPGQVAWFQFRVQAPMTPGTYRLGIRPLIEGAAWMEDYGAFWEITVLNGDGSLPARTPSDPAGVSFSIDPGVLASDIHDLHEGVDWMAQYLSENVGGDRTGSVNVGMNLGTGGQGSCLADGRSFRLGTKSNEWMSPPWASSDTWSADTDRMRLVAHEYMYLWQYELGADRCQLGPRWLTEGMADSFAYRAMDTSGRITGGRIDIGMKRQLTNGPDVTLRSLETSWQSGARARAVAYLAVDRLLADPNPRALRTYMERVRAGEQWQNAFSYAFGTDIETFYGRFDSFLAEYLGQ